MNLIFVLIGLLLIPTPEEVQILDASTIVGWHPYPGDVEICRKFSIKTKEIQEIYGTNMQSHPPQVREP
jgi:hypothetical protein